MRRSSARRWRSGQHGELTSSFSPSERLVEENRNGHQRDHQQDHAEGGSEADPGNLAHDVARNERRQQLQSVGALIGDVDEVEGTQRLNDRDDQDDDVDRPHGRENHSPEGLPRVRAVHERGLAQGRVDRLQAGQVQHHHVPDLPPRRLDQHRPQVQLGIAEPVDQVRVRVVPDDRVDQAEVGRVDELPDDPDKRQRQHDRQEQDRLVDATAADAAVDDHREQHADRGGEEGEDQQPDEIALNRGPERRVHGRRLDVVLNAEDAAVVGDEHGRMAGPQLDPADPAPLEERQGDGGERGPPDDGQVGEHGYREHRDDDHELRAGQSAPPAGPATPPRRRAGGSVGG